MSRAAACLAVLFASCNHVYGVDGADAALRLDAASDAAPGSVAIAGTLELDYVDSNPDGTLAPTMAAPFPTNAVVASVILDDGTSPAVSLGEDGAIAFTAAHAGQAYRLRLSINGGVTEFQLDQPTFRLGISLAGHRVPPAPVTVSTPLALTVSGGSATASYQLLSTGTWTTENEAAGSAVSLDWLGARSVSGPLGLLDASRGDRLFLDQFQTFPQALPGASTPASYVAVAFVGSAPVTLSDGGSASAAIALAPAARTSCVHLEHDQTLDAARLHALLGSGAIAFAASIEVLAVPDPTIGTAGAFELSAASTLGSAAAGLVVSQSEAFANPFPQPVTMAESVIALARPIGGGTALARFQLIYLAPFDARTAPCPEGPVVTLPEGGPLDEDVHVATGSGDVALASDGTPIALPAGPTVSVTWTTDGALGADLHQVTLEEVPASGTQPLGRAHVVTAGTSAQFPTDAFVVGHTYIVRFDASNGLPDAAHGDWVHRTGSLVTGTSWSSSFTVTAVARAAP